MAETDRPAPDGPEPIAVIGMAGRFPGADDVSQYWRNLRSGSESITWLDDVGLQAGGLTSSRLAEPNLVAAEGVLSDIAGFDADLFGIPPREAELMDPQHRLALEATWAAFDSAGLRPAEIDGSVGVFLGAGLSTYLVNNLLPNRSLMDSAGALSVLLHNDKDYLPATVSHRLGLRGPSLAIGTACSSSLVAVHLACQSLLNLESDLAVAGGVSVQVPQGRGHVHTAGGIYSSDGRCRAFDAAADGTVGGSGTGIVLLKRWSDAVRDGDHVHAVLLGSAVNNDGAERMGFTAPGVEGQSAVIVEAQAAAGVHADEIGYVEAHGTGTSLGDAIELSALKQAFATRTAGIAPCGLGSVKTNIGHLDAASGVAGLIKTVLAVEEAILPATLHFQQPNPELAGSPFRVIEVTQPWASGGPRTAGVSSFGMGGTNAHLIVREAPPQSSRATADHHRPATTDDCVPIVVSARDESALSSAGRVLAQHLEQHPDLGLAGVACTLAGRTHLSSRAVLFAATRTDMLDGLRHLTDRSADATTTGTWAGGARPLVLVLPDVNADHRGAGSAAAESLEAHVAAARALLTGGLQVTALLGRGSGEYAAAALAGIISIPDAVRLHRARIESPESYADVAAVIRSAPPLIRCLSSATGTWLGTEAPAAHHWLELCSAPDRFAAATQVARTLPDVLFHRIALPATTADEPHTPPGTRAAATDRALAELWTAGASVDWTVALADGSSPGRRRPPLPPRPLRHERFWAEPPPPGALPPPTSEEMPPRLAAPGEWLWQPSWRRTSSPAAVAVPAGARCLVLTDGPVGDAVAEHLRQSGADVIAAGSPSDAATAPASLAEFIADLAATDEGPPTHVVHLWAAESSPPHSGDDAALGLHTLLGLVRADAVLDAPGMTRLLMVTRGAHEVLGHDLHDPAQAMLGAVAKVVPLEYPNISASLLDLPPSDRVDDSSAAALATSVVAELFTDPVTPIAAVRGQHRWVPAVTAGPPGIPEPSVPPAAGGTYVVTGGLGAVGLALGESLVRRPASVVLVSRRPFPGRFDWERLTAGPAENDDEVSRIARRLLAAEKDGGEFLVLQADVANEDEMHGVVAVARRFGRIRGVVHAAGLADLAGMVQRRTAADTDEVLRAKVTGTLVLDRVLAGHRLDFFVLCSSLGTVLHKFKFGEVGYLAANEFLNAFAAHRAAHGHPETVSIAWTDWIEGGMSARARSSLVQGPHEPGAAAPRHGTWLDDPLRGITEAEGVAVFEQVISTRPGPLVLVSTQDLTAVVERHDALTARTHHALLTEPVGARPRNARPVSTSRSEVGQRLAQVWEELLGVTGVGPDDDFFQLGGDSLVALRFIQVIERDLGIGLSLVRIFERSTLRDVTAHAWAVRDADVVEDDVVIDP